MRLAHGKIKCAVAGIVSACELADGVAARVTESGDCESAVLGGQCCIGDVVPAVGLDVLLGDAGRPGPASSAAAVPISVVPTLPGVCGVLSVVGSGCRAAAATAKKSRRRRLLRASGKAAESWLLPVSVAVGGAERGRRVCDGRDGSTPYVV